MTAPLRVFQDFFVDLDLPIARLREECRLAKEALSEDTEASIPVMLPGVHTQVRITRSAVAGCGIIAWLIARRAFFSKWYGYKMNKRESALRVLPFRVAIGERVSAAHPDWYHEHREILCGTRLPRVVQRRNHHLDGAIGHVVRHPDLHGHRPAADRAVLDLALLIHGEIERDFDRFPAVRARDGFEVQHVGGDVEVFLIT